MIVDNRFIGCGFCKFPCTIFTTVLYHQILRFSRRLRKNLTPICDFFSQKFAFANHNAFYLLRIFIFSHFFHRMCRPAIPRISVVFSGSLSLSRSRPLSGKCYVSSHPLPSNEEFSSFRQYVGAHAIWCLRLRFACVKRSVSLFSFFIDKSSEYVPSSRPAGRMNPDIFGGFSLTDYPFLNRTAILRHSLYHKTAQQNSAVRSLHAQKSRSARFFGRIHSASRAFSRSLSLPLSFSLSRSLSLSLSLSLSFSSSSGSSCCSTSTSYTRFTSARRTVTRRFS